jgi:uncharacterized OsmC-like protein
LKELSMSEGIRSAIEAASAYLREHPTEARYTDSVATATLAGGLRFEVRGPGEELVATDMPASVGGSASAPSPGWLLRAAHASCVGTLIAMRAAQQAVQLDRLEVTVDSESDDRGILGLEDDVVAGPLHSAVRVSIASTAADDATLRELVDWAVDHCPVHDALRRAVPVHVEIQIR